MPKASSSSSNENKKTHTVLSGESLSSIAERNGLSLNELVKINNIPDANKINVGDVLNLTSDNSSNNQSNSSSSQQKNTAQNTNTKPNINIVEDRSKVTTTPKTTVNSDVPIEKSNLITMEQMKKMWPHKKATIKKMQPIMDELNRNISEYKLDTKLRKAHFFAQVFQEVGYNFRLSEDLYFRPKKLMEFSYYQKYPEQADVHGYIPSIGQKPNIEAIANNIYNDKYRSIHYKLGNIHKGDGYKYRGRGLKMLTGRENYTNFNKRYKKVWNENVNFIDNPDLVSQAKYSVRSAVWYWMHHKLYDKADKGTDPKVVNSITEIINKGTDSYGARRANFKNSYKIFK